MLASAFASLSILFWVAQYAGLLPAAYLNGPLWHGHEMLFGFALAVVGGFLFTAVRNWTGLPTPTGAALAACALLWLAGRVLVLTPFGMAAAVVNATPWPSPWASAFPCGRAATGETSSWSGLLLLLAVAALAFHLSLQGRLDWPQRAGIEAGLDIVLFIMAVVGGRVIPMFTNDGMRHERAARSVGRAACAGRRAGVAGDGPAAGSARRRGVHRACRRAGPWRPARVVEALARLHSPHRCRCGSCTRPTRGSWPTWCCARSPASGLVAGSFAIHALTVGAIGGMTIGMMTRTARGHTGRPLAADGFEVACYGLVMAAALLRVAGAMAIPALHVEAVIASGVCWSAAYGIYAVRYWPVLTRARVDGQPG